ncbi:hypothetical protein BP6252_03374 [Coleophoma cylindrospora]|uniref:Uncharacterized protein n=1 Tax=Coleophoma cylindrospora TaxID=1849047 RepID=A0A3D8S7I8_9HELO|nr:hypothetical protein BP6252_03374 [Coleophoma cylindrospora]
MVMVNTGGLVLERPEIKPSRSKTHPLRDPKAGKRRTKNGEPFDPSELSRRLEAHLKEQKRLRSERRASKAAAAPTSQNQEPYHHVPKVAASSFARTTTQDKSRKIHRLSQIALQEQLKTFSLDDPHTGQPLVGLQRSIAQDQVVIKQESLRSRNQFQWTQYMEKAVEVDADRDVYRAPQRTFETGILATQNGRIHSRVPRPLSTGDVQSEDDDTPLIGNKQKLKPFHQNDWLQKDDNDDDSETRRKTKERGGPFSRKRDSVWIMKGRREKPIADEGNPTPNACQNASTLDSKASRGKFLSRFKWHPS